MTPFEEIKPEEAQRQLDELRVLDVRAGHEFRGPLGRVPGSFSIQLPELAVRLGEIPTDQPLLVVCRSGARSGKACQMLASLAIGPVFNLTGGMIAWNRAEIPVEHTDPGSLAELVEGVAAWVAQVGPRTPEAVRAVFAHQLAGSGMSLDAPSHVAVDRLLDTVERELTGESPPPDLDLSLAAFRRWLAVL